MRIYVHHLRASKICLAGARSWWRRRGFDWHAFLKNGIDEEVLLATEDAQAIRVVEEAHERK